MELKYFTLLNMLPDNPQVTAYSDFDEARLEEIVYSQTVNQEDADYLLKLLSWMFDNNLVSFPTYTMFEIVGFEEMKTALESNSF